MKITIDASRLLTTTPTGVEVYCQEIIHGLLAKDSDLILYTPKLITNLPQNNQQVLKWSIGRSWSQLRLGFELLIYPPDVFFSPGYVIPFLGLLRKKIKKIVTIHDVAFIHVPDSYSSFQKWLLNTTTKQAVKHAHKIIVPTKTTKDDLIKYFNCREDKLELTYLGADHLPKLNKEIKRKKQILYVGRVETKKNIGNLIKAFKIFNKKYPDYELILAGKKGVGYKNVKCQMSNVKCLGYVFDEEKLKLLQESTCLVFVSNYEGFGIPLLEGFSYQLPVLASDIPVLKEIGQSACLFANPKSPQAIADGLEKITQDQELRDKLIQSGIERLQDFSWQKCVTQTWEVLNK